MRYNYFVFSIPLSFVVSFASVDNVSSSSLLVLVLSLSFVVIALFFPGGLSVPFSFSSLLDESSVFNRPGFGVISVSLPCFVGLVFPGDVSLAYSVVDLSPSSTVLLSWYVFVSFITVSCCAFIVVAVSARRLSLDSESFLLLVRDDTVVGSLHFSSMRCRLCVCMLGVGFNKVALFRFVCLRTGVSCFVCIVCVV
jgi:hypothetical protein